MKKKFFIIFGLTALILLAVAGFSQTTTQKSVIYRHINATIEGKTYDTLVSDTEKLRERGLSGMKSLSNGQAMLFVFEKSGVYGFWMKEMLFPIDIVWLDSNYSVVSFVKNLAPETYPKVFNPDGPSLYVLEFPAGTVDSSGINVGDKVTISGGK